MRQFELQEQNIFATRIKPLKEISAFNLCDTARLSQTVFYWFVFVFLMRAVRLKQMERVFSPNFPCCLALIAAIATTLMYNDTLDILMLIVGDSAHFPQGLPGKFPEVKLFLQRLSAGGRALHILLEIQRAGILQLLSQGLGEQPALQDLLQKSGEAVLALSRGPSERYPLHGSEPPPIFSAAKGVQKNVQA